MKKNLLRLLGLFASIKVNIYDLTNYRNYFNCFEGAKDQLNWLLIVGGFRDMGVKAYLHACWSGVQSNDLSFLLDFLEL